MSAPPSGAPLPSLRVLLVEDSAADARFIVELLKEAGPGAWSVERAVTLAAAEERLVLGGIDAVLLDLNLPDGRGADVVGRVCHANPELPVVVLTGLDDDAVALAAIHGRAQDYLVKGQVDGEHLDKTLRYAIERKRLDEELRHSQRMEALGKLAGGIAHDFNNLLGVIVGGCELLLRGGRLGEQDARRAQDSLKAAERAAALTRQLLTFGRRHVAMPEPVAVGQVLHDLHSMFQRLIGEDIVFDLDVTAPVTVRVDRAQFEQVIVNLIVNARDAMPQGGRLEVRADVADMAQPPAPDLIPGRYVRLSVADSGAGIAPDNLPHIFEPYFTTKSADRGTGLGLATVFGIVKGAGGHIAVSSRQGHGSVFTIFLPVLATTRPPSTGAALEPLPGGTETILLIEDEEALRAMTEEILQEQGYRVLCASSGAEAVRLAGLESGPVHLVLSDVVMPGGLSGPQTWAQIQGLRPEAQVIFMSGYSEESGLANALAGGSARVVAKPFNIPALLEAIRETVGRKIPKN